MSTRIDNNWSVLRILSLLAVLAGTVSGLMIYGALLLVCKM